MGNDGGSFSQRTEMVKTKKKEEKKDNFEIAKAKSRLCAMTKEPLKKPIAVCRMGMLYNKEEIIKRLIEKTIPRAFRHIRKLKDIKEANVELRTNKEDGSNVIVCPVSQIEMNGFNHFLMLWGCGCIFSEEAAKELGGLKDQCISCGSKIESKSDIVSLNQTPDEQLQFLKEFDEQQRLADEKAAKKKDKKLNKKRKEREDDGEGAQEGEEQQMIKRQKVKEGSELEKKSDVFKSLFTKQYEEKKDADFLCRCVHRGLR